MSEHKYTLEIKPLGYDGYENAYEWDLYVDDEFYAGGTTRSIWRGVDYLTEIIEERTDD